MRCACVFCAAACVLVVGARVCAFVVECRRLDKVVGAARGL